MAVVFFLALAVFGVLLAFGHARLKVNIGGDVATGVVALVLATVLGCLLVMVMYAETR